MFEASGGENEDVWKYLGHYRSHFKHITGVETLEYYNWQCLSIKVSVV